MKFTTSSRTQKCAVRVCINCFTFYHNSCAKKNPKLKILTNNRVICCKKPDINNIELENQKLQVEVAYLRKVIEEIKDTTTLILNRVSQIEKNSEKKENIEKQKVTDNLIGKEGNQNRFTFSGIASKSTIHQGAPQRPTQISAGSTTMPALQLEVPTLTLTNPGLMSKTNVNKTPTISKNLAINKVQNPINTNNEDSDGFQEVKHKKKRHINTAHKKQIGTGKQEDNFFSGPRKKVWMYIYRVNRTATEEKIKQYIQNMPNFENENVTVKEIPTTENRPRRFVVTAPWEKKEDLYKSEHWPTGVGIARFNFSRHREFLNQEGGNFF